MQGCIGALKTGVKPVLLQYGEGRQLSIVSTGSGLGIAPDIEVMLAQGAAPLLPQAEEGMAKEQVENSGDAQLLRALDLLTQAMAQGR